jgi:hypothetical protein
MKLCVTFDFQFDQTLSEEEITNRIELIEGWSESVAEAFLELPGGFIEVSLSHEFKK